MPGNDQLLVHKNQAGNGQLLMWKSQGLRVFEEEWATPIARLSGCSQYWPPFQVWIHDHAEFDENFLSGGSLEIHAVAGLYVGPGEGRELV
jgi:sulfur transfer protein SufE